MLSGIFFHIYSNHIHKPFLHIQLQFTLNIRKQRIT